MNRKLEISASIETEALVRRVFRTLLCVELGSDRSAVFFGKEGGYFFVIRTDSTVWRGSGWLNEGEVWWRADYSHFM